MPSPLIQLLVVGLVVLHLWAPVRVSLATLLASTFLIPATLPVPGAPGYVFVLRLGLWAAALGILVRTSRGEIDSRALRPSRLFIALALFVAVAYELGVSLAPFPSQGQRAFELWLLLADQLLFLWVATVAVRTLGVHWVVKTAVVLAVAIAVIGIIEHYVGNSYARWWFKNESLVGNVAAAPLERRGADQRVRATAQFALQYAWVLAFFLPLVSVIAIRARRRVALLAPAVLAAAFVFTITRSAYAGLAASAVILLACTRGDRRLVSAMAAAGVVVAFLYFGTSAIREPYSAAAPESVNHRERRLEQITRDLAPEPWLGIGLDGLFARNIRSTDTAYLSLYAGAGVVGLALFVGALGTATVTAAAAAVRSDDADAPLAGAVLGGVVSGAIAAFSFDSHTGPLASWNLWLIAAIAIGLSERASARAGPPRPEGRTRPSPWRLVVPFAGLATGLVIAAATPTHVAVDLRMFVLNERFLVHGGTPNDGYLGRIIIDSTCDAAHAVLGPRIVLDCRDPLSAGPGTGTVRIEARNATELALARAKFERLAPRIHPHTRLTAIGGPVEGRPTAARTAPVWVTILATQAAVLVPPMSRRSRRSRVRGRAVR